ncbi:MAG: PTS sugar transporter subunit IIA [Candidatus Cloacimonetes bacterium]|nr:PTS sugar transporter subunit IIA [Candidatus Cloacimonadota bacterium]
MWKEVIDKKLIAINPMIADKAELFEKMVNHVYSEDYIINRKKFLQALHEREELSNTELYQGVAFPHARTNAAGKVFVSIIILNDGIDYGNREMGDVKLVFFFGCPEDSNQMYLRLLAQTTRLVRNSKFRNQLLNAKSAEQVEEILLSYDAENQESEDDDNYLMIFVLNKPDLVSDVLSAMVELGIDNASLVDSISMARKLAYEIPVFAGLSYIGQGNSKTSTMIFCHIKSRETPQKLAKILKSNGIDLNKRGTGYIQTIKLANIIGDTEEDIDI